MTVRSARSTADLIDLCWPLDQLPAALDSIARVAGLRPGPADALTRQPPSVRASREEVDRWLIWAAGALGLEVEETAVPVPDIAGALADMAPALIRIRTSGVEGILLLKAADARHVWVVAPDGRVRRQSLVALRDLVCAPLERPVGVEVDKLLAAARIRPARRTTTRETLVRERLAHDTVAGFWLLRLPGTAPFIQQARQAGLVGRFADGIALMVAVYALEIAGWALIGQGVLAGRLDFGWLIAWMLLLLSNLPLRLCGRWLNTTFALDFGRLLKKRLLAGALRMDVDTVRQQGIGELLGRVIESQALESLALNGGLAIVSATIELAFAGWILAQGAGGLFEVALLVLCLATLAALAWQFHGTLRVWTRSRLSMTHALVESMVGHRTRLAQEWPSRRDRDDDRMLSGYLAVSRRADISMIPVAAAAGIWMALGLLGLAPGFVTGTATSAELAIGLGGVMLAGRAIGELSGGAAALFQAAVAWSQVSEIFNGAARADEPEPFVADSREADGGRDVAGAPLVEAHDVVYRYGGQGEPVLRGCDLVLRRGDRVLIEGQSGGGKSTLAALLAGLRRPQSGTLLLDGLDRHLLGPAWHRIATEAPQFHENHILSGTLAFNLLMGRGWPASAEDLAEAKALCIELGLGPLLQRMPAGLLQQVGETGWQLSHGERSRIFLARALLQDAALTILDESFAALDPETLRLCLECAIRRARTLVVIAHP